MTIVHPLPNRYHRMVGSHAPAMNRLAVGALLGIVTGFVVALFEPWQLAVLVGWSVSASLVLGVSWHAMFNADADRTAHLATLEDETRTSARVLLVVASLGSLVGVAFALHEAGKQASDEPMRVVLVGAALVTVVVSWLLINTVFTLRYAHLYYEGDDGGIDFGEEPPAYRDFAYLAFTLGMTYQVSDTALQDKTVRQVVLRHSLLAYVFGVVIVAMTINIVAGFL